MDEPVRRMACGRERKLHDPHKANRISSYIIPPILVLCAAYSCYAFYYMCIAWYLRNGRTATGVCLIVFQVLLVALMGSTFFRIVFTPAGYIPSRKEREAFQRRDEGVDDRPPAMSDRALLSPGDAEVAKTFDRTPSQAAIRRFLGAPSILDAPIYLADRNGTDTPRYCYVCDAFKHDRSHHCNEVNRCVMKQDHFCPWVGGPLGHARYKFFVQFITYVGVYSLYCFITLTIATVERRRGIRYMTAKHVPASPAIWYVGIGMAIFFALFMIPFSAFHLRLAALNQTTIESLSFSPVEIIVNRYQVDESGRRFPDRQRIVLSPGLNPFDLGPWRNLQAVFGPIREWPECLVDMLHWLLPIRPSPGDGLFHEYSRAVDEEIKMKIKD